MQQAEILECLGNIPANDLGLDALVGQIRSQVGVIPFVGAGMSASFGFQSWTAFLREAARPVGKTRSVKKQIAAGEYEEAAETLVTALTPSGFQDLVEGCFGDRILEGKELTGAVTLIPRLSSGPVITTNFDRLLERVFQDAGCPSRPVWHSKVNLAVRALEQNSPVLLKVHGDWEDPENRVLTLGEYKQYYGDSVDFNLPLPRFFELLAVRPVLFLGCSLNQDRTLKILKRVASDLESNRHYAVVEKPKSAAKFLARRQFLAAHHIRPVWYPEGEHGRIERLLEYLAGQVPDAYRRKTAPAQKPKTAIPRLPTSFIGREAGLKQLCELVPVPGLVTITGGPGAGKTRVAIELMRLVEQQFDSIWFVELSQLQEGNLVPQRVASVLGTREQAQKPPTEALADSLRPGKYLVVLDNCEHVRQACTDLADYLTRNCPKLTICATSREVLRVAGERLYRLPPLVMPPEQLPQIDELRQIESVRLFLERAGAQSSFQLTEKNAGEVAELCRELDGIPLAIELAAAQSALLSAQQILEHMNERLKLLRGGAGGTEERQWTTLREAIRFSYDMLNSDQQMLFRRLSVFRRGCTWEAATEVCRAGEQDPFAILELLNDLQSRSLLVAEDGRSEKRYRLLDSIREFAAGELGESETRTKAAKHAAWFLARAERAAPELLGKDQALWLDLLVEDADNFRAAIQWAVQTGNAETALRLMAALWRLSEIRGFLHEGRERLEMVLTMSGTEILPALRSKALSGAGMLAYRQGDMTAAKSYFTQSLEIERERQDKRGIANALNDLGNVAHMAVDFEAARKYFKESLALEQETKNARGVAVAQFNLGNCTRRLGKLEEAEDLLKRSWHGYEAAGNLREGGFLLNALALVALAKGSYHEGIAYAEKSLKIRTDLADKKGIADCKRTLGAIALKQPNLPRALELLTESLALSRGLEDRRGIAETLELFAVAAAIQKEFATCVALYAAAQQIRDDILVQLSPLEREQRRPDLDAALAVLGQAEFDNQQASGRELSLAAAMEMAQSVPGRALGHAIG